MAQDKVAKGLKTDALGVAHFAGCGTLVDANGGACTAPEVKNGIIR